MLNTIVFGAGKILRTLLFMILLFLHPFVEKALLAVSGICFLVFAGTLVLARDQITVLLALFTFGLIAAIINFCFQSVMMLLAPPGFFIGSGD